MSLVANYSDSDSSSDEESNDVQVTGAFQPCAKAPVVLPSADDLFADIGPKKMASFAAFSASSAPPRASSVHHTTQSSVASSVPKRALECSDSIDPKHARRKVRSLAPPQLRRPNVSTEDLSAWNTKKTMRKQEPAAS
ncbi:Aste57867_18708 [Aphanomyces stellatus]|uniref:Aste57867_18708 protein n=1 Tax=Aphanomyces stellatus TaxID=120398 RepID=A0A485LB17_9STRA|nr:hypothetical protein As57867_018644 [Aphanomyces stellatus]VFT95442.1 Aste57867_18708 [Aphanomyces stellatus]